MASVTCGAAVEGSASWHSAGCRPLVPGLALRGRRRAGARFTIVKTLLHSLSNAQTTSPCPMIHRPCLGKVRKSRRKHAGQPKLEFVVQNRIVYRSSVDIGKGSALLQECVLGRFPERRLTTRVARIARQP